MDQDQLNELLRKCEVELSNANYELNIILSEEDVDEYQEEISILMDRIAEIQTEMESLLKSF